jgi:tetratricopeptide (TPR) repeat protein
MIKRYFVLIAFLLPVIFIAGCSGSKSFSKKARKLQEAGLTNEAADFYYQSLLRNPQNIDAKIGLKQTGGTIVTNKLNEYYKAHSLQAYGEAVYKYREAMDLKALYSPFVDIEVPPYYEQYYSEDLDVYLEQRYDKASELVYEQKYEEADGIFKEILDLKPEYRDVGEMAKMTTVEPIYQNGVKAFDAGKYRMAYTLMEQVIAVKGTYKDAIDIKQMALEEATLTVAVVPFEDKSGRAGTVDEKLFAGTVQSLMRTKSPFIKVLDRSNLDQVKKEQQVSLESGGDLDITEMRGANVLITGKVLSYEKRGGQVQAQRQQGYESFRVKKVDPESGKTSYVTNYRKTYYTEYTGASEIFCTVQIDMVNTETGELMASEMIKSTKRDAVNYARYKGNYKNLYGGTFKSASGAMVTGDKVFTSYRDKQALNAKFTTSKTSLKSFAELDTELSEDLAKRIAFVVEKYNPDR